MSIRLENMSRTYKMGEVEVRALRDVSITINEGDFIVILGPSGCGKTTLLNLIGCLDRPTSGKISFSNNVKDLDLSSLPEKELSKFRRKNIGFVFQFYNLVGSLSAEENVEITANLTHSVTKSQELTKSLLNEVGIIGENQKKFPGQLSGGEQQRVSIARALAKEPKILLADEPTGNLDSVSTGKILKLLQNINKTRRVTMILVTHNVGISFLATKVVYLRDGKIYGTSDYDASKEEEFWDNLHAEPAINMI